jgi:hypothetical protein
MPHRRVTKNPLQRDCIVAERSIICVLYESIMCYCVSGSAGFLSLDVDIRRFDSRHESDAFETAKILFIMAARNLQPLL